MSLIITPLPNIPIIQTGDALAVAILASLDQAGILLADGDLLVLAQKIVSKAEGRWADLT